VHNIRNLGRVRFPAAAIALLMLTCGTPSSAWCASKNLWVANQNGVIELYSSKQLKKSGMPTPIELSIAGTAQGLAFDKSKNLWAVLHHDRSEVVQFTAAQLKNLKHDSNPTPPVVISTDNAVTIDLFGCSFDSQGNLWVADVENGSLDEISKAQLAAGSADDVTPNVIITSADLIQAQFVTFDKAGNAWVGDSGEDKIAEFTASQLTSGGSKSATVVLTTNLCPEGLVFDKNGNLWVAGACSDTVVKFASSQLSSTGSPTPTVTLSSASFSDDEPSGLALDSSGDLVVATFVGETISKFTSKQLKVSGSPVPKAVVTGSESGNNQIIFGPAF
jgi:ligand-binding sensor domain-containing protein